MPANLDQIKMIILDVDGTMTDGGVYITDKGEQFKKFNARDGMGIKLMHKAGYKVGIISHSKSVGMVTTRAAMLDIKHCYVGEENKINILKLWMSEMGLSSENVCFIGDDVNDLEIMKFSGLSVCPADAMQEIKSITDIQLTQKGGDGCVREFYESYLKPRLQL